MFSNVANDSGTIKILVAAIEQMVEMLVITEVDGKIRYCNPAFEKVTGYSKEEAIGQNPKFLQSGRQSTEFYAQLWATIKNGEVWKGRFINRRKDTSYYDQESTISPIRGASGEISGFVALNLDITEKLELERRYLQAQKLESVGRLAGGLAHDFNNLLTVINGYSELLLHKLGPTDPLRRYATEIGKAGGHAASLTTQLLAFSRKQAIEPRVLDVNAEIRGAAPMLQRLIGEGIAIELLLDSSLGKIKADPQQIQQIIMNLVINGRDAMADGGRIEIATVNIDLSEDGAGVCFDVAPKPYVLITVTDTGHGMNESIRHQVFEPFFTTKEVGKGTGLGLSTVYGIVHQSGGWVDLWSEVDVGTSFKIYLPRVEEAVIAEPEKIGARAKRGSETILLVDDQDAVRSYVKTALEEYGYRVVEASSGNDAILAANCHLGVIDLLVTDVVMRGMSGKQLAEKLRLTCGTLKVLFVSGEISEAILPNSVPVAGVSFLQKPFTPDAIAVKVRQALDSDP